MVNHGSMSLSDDSVKVSVSEDTQSVDESKNRTMRKLLNQGRNGRYLKAKAIRSIENMLILPE